MSAEGKVVGGKYRLEALLGEGGMGAVWRATHLGLDSKVAIKLIHARGPSPDRVIARFLGEAKAAAAVRHRNVVSITDFGTAEDGQPYMVMELLEGTSLANRLEKGAPMPVTELLDVVSQCLSGLSAVHAAGIVHRDLKPENVFLVDDEDGVYPKLLDFGVSRSVPGSGSERRGAMTTSEGLLVGTPHYMSPEQARGLRDIDRRTDLYAVGVILYETLAGRLPYDSENVGDLIMVVTKGGAPPLITWRPDLGQALSDVVEKAMSNDREQRYPDARSMRRALIEAAADAVGGFPARTSTGDFPRVDSLFPRAREDASTMDRTELAAALRSDPPPSATPGGGMPLAGTPQPRPRRPSDAEVARPPVVEELAWSAQRRASAAPPARRRWPYAVGALALATAAVITWVAIPGEPATQAATPAHDTTHAARPAAPVPTAPTTSTARTPSAVSGEVHVTLRDVPVDAIIVVDGNDAGASPLTLPRDGRLHAIEVRRAGMVPWRIGHTATDDGTYAVSLEALPPSTPLAPTLPVQVAANGRRHVVAAATTDAGAHAHAAATPTEGLFGDPGF